jgi:hypothetical protein
MSNLWSERSVLERARIDESDLLQLVSLGQCEYLRHDIVADMRIRPQVNLRLRILGSFGAKVALKLRHALNTIAIPQHGAVEFDVQIDGLRLHPHRRWCPVRQLDPHAMRQDRK